MTTFSELLSNQKQALFEGVKKLISMTEPAPFLSWLLDLSQVIHWYQVHKDAYDQSDDHHYAVNMIIEGIVLPWLTVKEDMKEKMAEGFFNISDYMGSEAFRPIVSRFFEAHFFDAGDHIYQPQDIVGIQILMEIGNALHAFETIKINGVV